MKYKTAETDEKTSEYTTVTVENAAKCTSEMDENTSKYSLETVENASKRTTETVQNASNDETSSQKPLDNRTCNICQKSFGRKDNLVRHLKTHDNSLFSCRSCHQFYDTQEKLDDHRKRKHGSDYLCVTCGKIFRSLSTLTEHSKRHDVEAGRIRSYHCPVEGCQLRFVRKSLYDNHVNMHTKANPMFCGNCSRVFYNTYKKKQHEDICYGLKQIRCEECSMSFTDSSTLKRHNMSKHLHQVYTCVCGRMYNYYSSLFRHKQEHQH